MVSTTPAKLREAQLIGLDWGSTGLRAFLIGEGGVPLVTRNAPLGASVLSGHAAYEQALQQFTGDWQSARPDLPLLACGMVGSKHGWREVPYVDCPADAKGLAARMLAADTAATSGLRIVPGLLDNPTGGTPDVMRGEETQIIGAMALHPELANEAEACIVLPGTHSKWAHVRGGRILGFATQMTGELFAVLRSHSVLGRLMADDQGKPDMPSFLAGVDAALEEGSQGLLHQLFTVRSLGLMERLPARDAADYLSGLLIGHELVAGVNTLHPGQPLALVGEPALCERYAEALKRFRVRDPMLLDNTAPAGLWKLAGELELSS